MREPAALSFNKGQRIEFIDAMRGFTMILVVLHHVAAFCWKITDQVPSIHEYLLQFRMPLFFFISGFVLYKAGVTWNMQQVVRFFKKKIPVQLLSPLVFFLLFVYVRGYSLTDAIGNHVKYGYWFTFVLLEYYVFYAVVRFFIRKKWADVVLVIMGLVFYTGIQNTLPISAYALGVLSTIQWRYFIFFVFGTLVKEHYHLVEEYLDSKWLLAIVVSFYFLVNFFSDSIPVHQLIISFCLSVAGLIIVFSFFRKKQSLFTRDKVLGLSLQYIGRRTLDIYLIHFFLLPKNLSVFTLFRDYPMPIIEATASLLVALLVIAGSLLVSNIVRLSPVLAHWMFGAKYPKSTK